MRISQSITPIDVSATGVKARYGVLVRRVSLGVISLSFGALIVLPQPEPGGGSRRALSVG